MTLGWWRRITGIDQRISPPRHLKHTALAACLAALSLAAGASPAGAAVTIGQLAPGSPPPAICINQNQDLAQPPVTSGNPYAVPLLGVLPSLIVTSWSHSAAAGSAPLTFKVYRGTGPNTYRVVGHDGPRSLSSGVVHTFSGLRIPVRPGDVIGLHTTGASSACLFNAPGDRNFVRDGDLADGQEGAFTENPGERVNVTAVVEPDNRFTFGKVKLNKEKGTARLTLGVPNPGELTGSGKGVNVAGAAVISKSVPAAGPVNLKIRAKGKKKRKLNETGKVKVKPKITYTPTGGDPATQSKKLKLKKRQR
jgi:hypothetical protein